MSKKSLRGSTVLFRNAARLSLPEQKFSLNLSVSALVLLSLTATASAQCAPDPAMEGDIVLCTGFDDDGISINSASNVSITVESDAHVGNADLSSALSFRGGVLLNYGSVLATGRLPKAISAGDFSNEVIIRNFGALESRETLTDPISGPGGVTATFAREFSNSGTIAVFTSEAAHGRGSRSVDLSAAPTGVSHYTNDGEITSQSYGVTPARPFATSTPAYGKPALAIRLRRSGNSNVDGGIQFENNGLISAVAPGDSTALDISGDILFVNTGEVTAKSDSGAFELSYSKARSIIYTDFASDSSTSIHNSGTISAIRSDPLVRAHARFNHYDEVSGNESVAIETIGYGGVLSIDNSGEITADIAINAQFDSVQIVTNSGKITGDIFLRAGADSFINSGIVDGDIDLGSGADLFESVGSTASVGKVSGGADMDTLAFRQASGLLYVGQYSNFEHLEIAAKDDVVISHDSAVRRWFKDITIRSGRVAIETNLSKDITVLRDGVLRGNGTIFGDVKNLGMISPGASIGTLRVNGVLVFDPSSVLEIEFDGDGADLLSAVTEKVTIDDATLLLTPLGGGLSKVNTYTFLVGAYLIGGFSKITLNGFTGSADISESWGRKLSVTITPQYVIAPGFSANAATTASYLNSLILSGDASDDADDVISSLFVFSDDAGVLESALLSVQPGAFAATPAISVEQALLMTDLVRMRAAQSSNRTDGLYFWLSGGGGFSRYEGDLSRIGASSFDVDTHAVIGGAEIVRGDAAVGVFGGTLGAKQMFQSSSSTTEVDGFAIGGYGAWRAGGFHTNASLAYILTDAETDRFLALLGQRLQSEYGIDAFTAQMQSRYDISAGAIRLSPVAGLTYARTARRALAESGGVARLALPDQHEEFLYLDIGAEAAGSFVIGEKMGVRPSLSMGWRYEALGHGMESVAALASAGVFDLPGRAADFDRSRLMIGGDVAIDLGARTEIFARYRGEYGADYSHNSVEAGLAIHF